MVAVNIDTRDPEKPKNFLKDANLTRLGYFSDQKAKVFQDLKSIGRALGMPTSVLVDGQGCEIATIAGPAEWASDDAIKLITAAMKPVGGGALGRNVEIAADAGGEVGQRGRGRAAEQGQDREFLRIGVRFQDARSATCICVLPAWAARRLLTMLIISIRTHSGSGTLPGDG